MHTHPHGGHHGHGHGHGELQGKRLLIAILLNLAITAAQAVGGVLSGSLSLLSDALHNASDTLSLGISWIAAKLARRAYSERHTFGFRRAEIIAAAINTASLLAISALLVVEAIDRLGEPVAIEAGWVMALALAGIAVNGGSMLALSAGMRGNMNLRAAWLHLLADLLTSVAVLIGGALMYFWQLWWVDSLLSIAIACYLVYASWGLLMQTLRVLMQFTPAQLELAEVEAAVCALPQVENLHHVHAWQLDDRQIHFEAHLQLAEDLRLSQVGPLLERVRDLLAERFGIGHVLLQPEYAADHASALVADETDCAVSHAHGQR